MELGFGTVVVGIRVGDVGVEAGVGVEERLLELVLG